MTKILKTMEEKTNENSKEVSFMFKIDRDLWNQFKAKIPKTMNMDEAVIEAIKAYKEDKKEVV